tara:strand:+ start:1537 stop:2136 length:600 start_codon:yes stop_codon:yes gene_type:complete
MKIITALWGDKYSEEDVKKLPIDICFSDRKIDGIKTIPIDMSYKHTWKKMTLFDSRLGLGECLFLDLDIELRGSPTKLIRYYQGHGNENEVTLARVHWFDNHRMKKDKATYIPCNVNSGVFAFNNDKCNHIYEELVKWKPKLEMLFEGTDKWFYHKHKDWYNFFPGYMIQHESIEFEPMHRHKAIVISKNGNARGRNKS